MSVAYEIVPASILDVKPMARKLRAAACITLQGFGLEPREALRRAVRSSPYCRTALVEGKPVAMWGVREVLLSDTAVVWLVLSEEVTRMPLAIVREAKAELDGVMEAKREVAITVLPDDDAAIRFAVFLGFDDRGDDERDEGELSRHARCAAIRQNPRNRIPVGDSYVIALGHRAEGMH